MAFVALLICCFWGSLSLYAQTEKPQIGERDVWVKNIPFPKELTDNNKATRGIDYLLVDRQVRVEDNASYAHVAYRITHTEGIQYMSDLSVVVDPSYQQLRFHFLRIHRGGKVIDVLADHEFESFRSEDQSDRYLYNGSVTHRLHIRDIRVGDVVEYAFTRRGTNPALGTRFCHEEELDYSTPVRQYYFSVLTPSSRPLKIRNSHMERAKVETLAEGAYIRYQIKRAAVPGVKPDNRTPSWHTTFHQLSFSEYASWAELVQWALPFYRLDETRLANIRALYRNPIRIDDEESITEAIRFVQEDVRYLGFEMGESGYKPNPPEQVFRNRFGDCKDKSLLLAAILQSEGIEAYPMLVNTETGMDLNERLPSPLSFNHCIVYITLRGQEYYVDPTIAYQRGGLNNRYCPRYYHGLVLREGETKLHKMRPSAAPSVSVKEFYEELDSEGSVDYKVVTKYDDAEADRMRAFFAASDMEDVSEYYLTFYRTIYPHIKQLEAPEIEDDEDINTITVTEHYLIPDGFFEYEGSGRKLSFEPWYLKGYIHELGSKDRTSPYYLGERILLSQGVTVQLLDRWADTFEQVNVDHNAFDYWVMGTVDGNRISVDFSYTIKEEHVMLPKFAEYYEKREEVDNATAFNCYEHGYERQMGITQQKNKKQGIAFILSFFGGGLVFFCCVVGAIVVFLYHNPEPKPHDPELAGITGWLVFVAIGLSITPIFYLVDVISGLIKLIYFAGTDELSVMPWRIVSFLLDIVLLILSMLLALCFFLRRSNTPLLFKIMLVLWALATCANFMLAHRLGAESSFYVKEFFRILVLLVLWMPFFIFTDQVRATFVKTVN